MRYCIMIALLLLSSVALADEIMLVGGKITYVQSYNGDDGFLNEGDGEFQALSSLVRGKVRDQYGHYVDTGIVRSNGICATASGLLPVDITPRHLLLMLIGSQRGKTSGLLVMTMTTMVSVT